MENIEQRVETFEILSRRQKFARFLRRVGWGIVAIAALAVLIKFAPALWRLYQDLAPAKSQ